MPFLANIFSCFAMEKGLKLAPFGTVPGIQSEFMETGGKGQKGS
jgi:hypothetical protein